MNELELKNIWNLYNRQLEESKKINLQSLALNIQTFEHLKTEKAKSGLRSLGRQKVWMILAGILYVGLLIFLITASFPNPNLFFVASIAAIAVFNIVAIVSYIRHTVLISEIDNTENLVDAQQKTARLQMATLQIVRFLFLQAPFYCTFTWNMQWINSSPLTFWGIAFPVALIFAGLSVWLYLNIKSENADKKWFRVLFGSNEWTAVVKAMEYLKEIEEYKNSMSAAN